MQENMNEEGKKNQPTMPLLSRSLPSESASCGMGGITCLSGSETRHGNETHY